MMIKLNWNLVEEGSRMDFVFGFVCGCIFSVVFITVVTLCLAVKRLKKEEDDIVQKQ